MSNDVNRAWASSVSAKVGRAAMLAAVLVAFGSVGAQASTIAVTHTYSEPGVSSNIYDFEGGAFTPGGYSLELTFDQLAVGAEFDLTVVAESQDPSDLEPRFDNNFPNSRCVTFATGGTQCVDFEIMGKDANTPFPTQDSTKWIGSYNIDISWFLDTNADFPNDANRIRILHNRGDKEGDNFDTDITRLGSYFPGGFGCGDICIEESDPAIGGRDDNFQSFTVVQVSDVPEPATMLLLGSGLVGLVRHQRRRLKSLATSERTLRG